MTTPNLSDKAMLVKLNISQWTARKYDKAATAKVSESYGNNNDMGRYNKSLIAKGALEKIKKVAGYARTFHYANTLAWDDNGARLLPSKHYMTYGAEMRKFNTDFQAAVEEFAGNYPDYINDAKIKLNGLFNPAEYPSISEINEKFSMRIHVDPFPASEDFRVSLNEGEVARIKDFINERNRRAIEAANRELWQRMYAAVNAIVERLGTPDAIFRDSLIGNVQELVGLLPSLNVTDNKDLNDMCKVVEKKLAGLNPDTLRMDETQRVRAANEAKKILSDMKGKFGWGAVADIKSNSDDNN